MSNVRVQLALSNSWTSWNNVPIAAEIVNSELEVVDKMTMQGENEVLVDLSPGFYLIRARLPSGEDVTAQAVVSAEEPETTVTLHASQSPHEWLAWQHFLGELPSKTDAAPVQITIPTTWLSLWEFQHGQWNVLPTDSWLDWQQQDENVIMCQLNQWRPKRLRMIQVGGAEIPWRLSALPPTPEPIQILIRPSRNPTALNGGLVLKVASLDYAAETLAHYLRSGSLKAADFISQDVVAQAEEQLQNKLQNPMGAAIGGYYLLQTREFEKLHNWPNNFANWIDWLPDGAVIHAWQLLYQAGEQGRPQARERLLQASQRGLPVFPEGLRLLIDGLELFATHAAAAGDSDNEVEQELKKVRHYASAVNWLQRTTTFTGPSPTEPSLEAKTGMAPFEHHLAVGEPEIEAVAA